LVCQAFEPMKTSPRSSVLIDLAAVRHNVAHLRALLAPGGRMLVAGRVSMDPFGVDVGTDRKVKVGAAVTLIGADGDERITVEEVAHRLGTINYEITCDIALDRSERVFINDQA
jgi:alanine racemase